MKITKIVRYRAERVHTDEEGYPIYQRYSGGLWERVVGDRWVSNSEELEKIYREKKTEWKEKVE